MEPILTKRLSGWAAVSVSGGGPSGYNRYYWQQPCHDCADSHPDPGQVVPVPCSRPQTHAQHCLNNWAIFSRNRDEGNHLAKIETGIEDDTARRYVKVTVANVNQAPGIRQLARKVIADANVTDHRAYETFLEGVSVEAVRKWRGEGGLNYLFKQTSPDTGPATP